jgi:hypothetical protein
MVELSLRLILELYWREAEQIGTISATIRKIHFGNRNWNIPKAENNNPFSSTTKALPFTARKNSFAYNLHVGKLQFYQCFFR